MKDKRFSTERLAHSRYAVSIHKKNLQHEIKTSSNFYKAVIVPNSIILGRKNNMMNKMRIFEFGQVS